MWRRALALRSASGRINHFMRTAAPALHSTSSVPRVYYGWSVLLVAAAAMVGTLPGRTQGLGLITEPLLADLHLDRLAYAELNLWATLLGSAGAIGLGHLIHRFGSPLVLTTMAVAPRLVGFALSP